MHLKMLRWLQMTPNETRSSCPNEGPTNLLQDAVLSLRVHRVVIHETTATINKETMPKIQIF